MFMQLLVKPYGYKLEFADDEYKYPIYYENEYGYFEKVTYDDRFRVIKLETPSGCEYWKYFKDSLMLTYHEYSNGVKEYWVYDEEPIKFTNLYGVKSSKKYKLTKHFNSLGLMMVFNSVGEIVTSNDMNNSNYRRMLYDKRILTHEFNFGKQITKSSDELDLRYMGSDKLQYSYSIEVGNNLNNFPRCVTFNYMRGYKYDETVNNDVEKRSTIMEECYSVGSINSTLDNGRQIHYGIKVDINGVSMHGYTKNHLTGIRDYTRDIRFTSDMEIIYDEITLSTLVNPIMIYDDKFIDMVDKCESLINSFKIVNEYNRKRLFRVLEERRLERIREREREKEESRRKVEEHIRKGSDDKYLAAINLRKALDTIATIEESVEWSRKHGRRVVATGYDNKDS